MRRFGLFLAIVAIFAALLLATQQVALALHWDVTLTRFAAFVLIAPAALAGQAWIRKDLARKLAALPEDEHQALAEQYDTVKYALPNPNAKTISTTVTVGVLLVNLPILPLLIAPVVALHLLYHPNPPYPHIAAALAGFVLAWAWWSVAVSKWRRWAESRGMTADEVQYHGEQASILWPKGHLFERTEWNRLSKNVR